MLTCGEDDFIRITSCALPGASNWLTDVRSALEMLDDDVRVAVCLRLGLRLSVLDLSSCPLCGADMHSHPTHPLGCVKLRRAGVNKRHDSCQNGLAGFCRANLCLVHVTPKLEDSKVPDLDIVFAAESRLVDVSGTDPLAPSIRRAVAGIPGQALKIRAGEKFSKYRDMAAALGKEFFPFAVESYGGLGEEALKLLDLVALEGLSLGPSARMTKVQFLSWLSVDWQRHNARIVREWNRLVRRKL